MSSDKHPVLLGVGANLGERQENIAEALEGLREFVDGLKSSLLYRSEPYGFEAERDFLNCVVYGETGLAPEELMERLRELEDELGRDRDRDDRSRIIDIDIILLGDGPYESELVEVPHPRWRERSFVVIPILELADEHGEIWDWLERDWDLDVEGLEELGGELSAKHPLTPVMLEA